MKTNATVYAEVGQRWCIAPPGYHQGGIVIESSGGCLVLCQVLQSLLTGELKYQPLKAEDLPRLRGKTDTCCECGKEQSANDMATAGGKNNICDDCAENN